MSGQVTISRSTIVLTVALVAALLAVAVLATVVLTDGNSNPTQAVPLSPNSESHAEPIPATSTVQPVVAPSSVPSVEPTPTPTEVPTAQPTPPPTQPQVPQQPASPTAQPTVVPNPDLIPVLVYFEAIQSNAASVYSLGVFTYPDALANSEWQNHAGGAANAASQMLNRLGVNLGFTPLPGLTPCGNSVRSYAVAAFGYWAALSGGVRRGDPASWNAGSVEFFAPYLQAISALSRDCGPWD